MAVNGTCVAVSISASAISATVEQMPRPELVDLARIARHPKHPTVMRAMLRLWRDYLAPDFRIGPDWTDTTMRSAVSYALPGKAGNLYRFDGWIDLGPRKPWAGAATWSRPSVANTIDDGVKNLWAYPYDARERTRLRALSSSVSSNASASARTERDNASVAVNRPRLPPRPSPVPAFITQGACLS